MADAVVEILVQNLISLLSGEIRLVRGFKNELEKLKNKLCTTQEFLSDAEDKQINDKTVKKWLKELEDVAYEADAVLDEINYHFLHKKLETTKKVSFSFSTGSISLVLRRKLASKINDINNKLAYLNRDNSLKKGVVKAPYASMIGLDQETNSYSIETNFVGREDDVAEIVEMVLKAPAEEKISVIPIVGMGGLGKTTLTRQIFQHEKIASCFENKIWICVSLKFEELTLFQKMYSTLTGENGQLLVTTEVVLQKIREVLDKKRYLMILDDVWNVDSRKWEDFMKSLLGISNAMQNVILVTTRQEHVASLVETLPCYKLRGLSDDDCWYIIKAKVTTKEKALSKEYEEIGKQFAQKCGGLPLAAHVIGSLLCNEQKEKWFSILTDDLPKFQRDGDNDVMRILMLSYNRLPSSLLKKCFAYCSVFPQDFNIEKETLIEQWMGEGFLQTNQENVNLETVGNKVFNQLLQVSLFKESKRDDLGNITHCIMHDCVHDLAVLVSGDRSGIVKDNGNDKARYLYLQSDCISNEQAKYLRTLIFDGKVADHMFPGYSRLRVVTLTNWSIQNLPIEIEKQIHMRFLDISRTKIERLPDSINKLSNLQTLVATRLRSLPNTIIELTNLRHLHISSIELPPFIGKLTSLQTLPYYIVGHCSGCRISELKNLKNLKGILEIQNLERVKDKGEAEHADMFGKSAILKLVLVWGNLSDLDRNDEKVLEGLQPHPNLKSLTIRGYRSINFPSWTMKMTVTVCNDIEDRRAKLTNLINICLVDCQCEKIPNLGHLSCLKAVELKNLPAVQSIGPSFYGLDDCSTSAMDDNVSNLKTTPVFPALQKLCLLDMPALMEWADVESRVAIFPCLEKLKIRSCPQLESTPTCFPCLKKLYIDDIGSNVCLTNICRNTSSLQKLSIKHYSGTVSLGDKCFVKNHHLSSLEIENCPNIMGTQRSSELTLEQEEDSNTFHGLYSLKKLRIIRCPELKSIPNFDLRSLQTLEIRNCPELKSIPNFDLRSLQTLFINDCPELKSIPNFDLRSLQTLYVNNYPKLKSIPNFDLRSLQTLEIRNCPELKSIPNFDLRSLQILYIENCPELKSILNFDLRSLQELYIIDCPELKTIHNIDVRSLKELYIGNCPELKTIHNFDVRSLQTLDISGCPVLTCFPLESCTTSLFSLTLKDLPNVENMDFVKSSISRMLRLECLILVGVPKFTNLPFASRSLYDLEIGGFSELLDVVSFSNYLKFILQESPNLQILTIIGNEDWESLPDHVQHLHALNYLMIKDCGIQALPEWIGNLSSLRRLWVINCERLQHLPSKENMYHLTDLWIQECPLLAERIQTELDITPGGADADYDSEWAKIYHIENVRLDRKQLPTRNFYSPAHSPVQDEKKFDGCFSIPQSWKR